MLDSHANFHHDIRNNLGAVVVYNSNFCTFFTKPETQLIWKALARVSTSCCSRGVVEGRAREKETSRVEILHVVEPAAAWFGVSGRFLPNPDDGRR